MEKLIFGIISIIVGPLSLVQFYHIKKKYFAKREQVDGGTMGLFYAGIFGTIVGLVLILSFILESG